MASFKIEIDGVEGTIKKTLNFMGKDYTETWLENGSHCDCGLEALVERDYPDMDKYDKALIESLTAMDEDELLEALGEITDFERRD